MAGVLVLLMLFGALARAADLRFSSSLWGFQAFQERAEVWAREHGHRLIPYEVGRMADNQLALYRQALSAHSQELDILLIDTIWPGVLGEHLVDLRRHLPARSIDQHFRPLIDNLTDGEGRLVGMPLYTDAGLLYYRQDLLDKYGFAPPATWSELERIARAILEREADPQLAGFVWQGYGYEGLTCNALEWIDSYRGGTIIDDRGEITINNPRARRAPGSATSPRARCWPTPKWKPRGSSSRVRPSSCATGWNTGRMWSPLTQRSGDEWASCPFPRADRTASTPARWGIMSLAVSRYSDQIPEAIRLVASLTDRRAQWRYATDASFSPTIVDLYDALGLVKDRAFMLAFKDVLLNGVARPSTVTWRDLPQGLENLPNRRARDPLRRGRDRHRPEQAGGRSAPDPATRALVAVSCPCRFAPCRLCRRAR
ncbi:hypothetical protein CCR95_21955 [Thiocystis minor]|uniref:extracellular solute-binding protein n=1 Tax=Thiocystis minor TaxID=61597 RepID=UPI001913AB1A|nr:extracellular solute-binding protein [Thiocystis minor]MBK5966666.1 hypothetical protein [Thiocystis minor]